MQRIKSQLKVQYLSIKAWSILSFRLPILAGILAYDCVMIILNTAE